MDNQIDLSQIRLWWDVMKCGRELVEIRVFVNNKTYSGYFKSVDAIIRAISPYSSLHSQIYFTLNNVNDGCYARSPEVIRQIYKEPTTNDDNITFRRWVLIDLDPKRPSGVSSTDAELRKAHLKAVDIYRWLLNQGFSEPLICMSGNGYHLMIPCYLPNDLQTRTLLQSFLQVVSMLFSDGDVDVDESVYNASRICKLYGVYAKKGANTEDRPWRLSKIIKIPSELAPVDVSYFRKVADLLPNENTAHNQWHNSGEKFNLVDFFDRHGIGYNAVRVAGGTKYILDHCPFDCEHKGKDAAVFQRDSGAIGFLCFHNSCSGRTWRDVRLLFEPDAYKQRDFHTSEKYHPQDYQAPEPIIQSEEKGKIWLQMSEIRRQPFSISDFIPSGITELDRRGIGFKRGMVSVWTGKRGCGKSSLLNMVILNATQRGYKSALWTGELTGDMVKQWLYLQAAGRNNTQRFKDTDFYVTKEDVIDSIDKWTDGKIWLFNNKYGDNFGQIEDQIKKLYDEQHIDQVLLDNLMVLDIRMLEENKYDRQAILMQRLEDLSKQLNIHIHLVAHPHKSLGYIRVDNVGGSGDITNKADNVFVLSRVNNDFKASAPEYIDKIKYDDIINSGCTNVIEIGKFRSKGTLMGEFVKLWFEGESNRLKNSESEHIVYGWDNTQVCVPDALSFYDEPSGEDSLMNGQTIMEEDECPF